MGASQVKEFHHDIVEGDVDAVKKKLEDNPKLANALLEVENEATNTKNKVHPLSSCVEADQAEYDNLSEDTPHYKIAVLLLNTEGIQKDLQDNEGYTPFSVACKLLKVKYIKLFIKHKCSVMTRNNEGRTCFETFIEKMTWQITRTNSRIYRRFENIDEYFLNDRKAARTNRLKFEKVLIDTITDFLVDAEDLERDRSKFVDKTGFTPIHWLAWAACYEAIGELITAGFPVTRRNDQGKTPLQALLETPTNHCNFEDQRYRFNQTARILFDAEKFDSEEEAMEARKLYVWCAAEFPRSCEDDEFDEKLPPLEETDTLLYYFLVIKKLPAIHREGTKLTLEHLAWCQKGGKTTNHEKIERLFGPEGFYAQYLR